MNMKMYSKEEDNFWVGVIIGCAMGILFSVVCFFCIIKQNDNLEVQVKHLTEMVQDHERIMRAYEFFNWKMEMQDE